MLPETDIVALALDEDLGDGDVTTRYFTDPARIVHARIFAKEACVLSGGAVAQEVFRRVDATLQADLKCADGTALSVGDEVLHLHGGASSILTGERVALNFLQRLSGVATVTRAYVDAIKGTNARILDTRKTTPGWRVLEKAAVKAGGGENHRMGLHDMVMVKDNHLAAGTSLAKLQQAIHRVKQERKDIRVELEADTIEQVREFLTLDGVDVILLDNMEPARLREAVALGQGSVIFEASGGVTLKTIRAIAETGVDFISVGALTHSARAVDFSLEILDEA